MSMPDLLSFDEETERKHATSLIGLMLDRSFGRRSEFDHMFMSAGESLGRCLEHLRAADFQGTLIVLTMSKDDILERVQHAPLSELPALTDVLDVALCFCGQYDLVPRITEPDQAAEFDPGMSGILQNMGLLNQQLVSSRPFLSIMLNHHFLVPNASGWDERVSVLLKELCETTWDGAPSDFKDAISGKSDRPIAWAEGYLAQRWRYGSWLTKEEMSRSIFPSHPALPFWVSRMLAEERSEVATPPNRPREP